MLGIEVHELVSMLLIIEEILLVFGNDSLLACVRVDIDSGRDCALVWH